MEAVEDRLTDEQLAQIQEMRDAQDDVPEGVDPVTGEIVEPERQEIPPSSATADEKLDRDLTKENTRHENTLKRLYGDSFDQRVRCPVCDGEGFPLAGPDMLSMMVALGDQAREAIGDAALGFEHPDELVPCERCKGQGQVATGAVNEHHAVIVCKTCEGRGYFDTSDPIHHARLNPPAPVDMTPPAIPTWAPPPIPQDQQPLRPPDGWHAAGSPGADQWGRWPGHQRYGIDPATAPGGW